jgi:hypothetical protein
MNENGLRALLGVTDELGYSLKRLSVPPTPSPCFLQEYDSTGIKGWGVCEEYDFIGVRDKTVIKLRKRVEERGRHPLPLFFAKI